MVLPLVSLAAIATTACHRAKNAEPGIAIQQEIRPYPAQVGPATLTLKVADAHAAPVTGARITVEADMSHPGMSPAFSDARETAPGVYAAPVDFSMGGDWIMLLHVQLADGKKFEREMNVRGVRSK